MVLLVGVLPALPEGELLGFVTEVAMVLGN